MQHRFKIGRAYKIKFLDHVKDGGSPVLCRVFGTVIKEDSVCIVVAYWEVEDEDAEIVAHNREVLTIVKKAIKSKKLLD